MHRDILLFANLFCLLNLQKMAKKKKKKSSITSLNHCTYIFRYECNNILCLCFGIRTYVGVRVLNICVICLVIKWERLCGSGLLFYDLKKKGVP